MPTKTLTPEEARLEKNKQIAKTMKETKVRRKEMICKTYSLKFSKTRISKKAWADLNQVFKEGKWLYNEILASEDIFGYDTKGKKTVLVFNPITEEYEERRLEHLGSQVMQGICSELKQNIVNLSKAKKKGRKVGALRFKSETNSIPLKQAGLTFKFKPNSNFRQVRIQGLKNWYYVRGGKQLRSKEIALARLVRNGCGIYLNVTVFEEKPSSEGKAEYLREEDGIDFGLGKQITNTVGNVPHFGFSLFSL